MSRPTIQDQTAQERMMEVLDEHAQELGSETYRQMSNALLEMDEVHTKLYKVEWALLTIKGLNSDRKIEHKRRTAICRLLPTQDAVNAELARLDRMAVHMEDVPNMWHLFLYQSLLTPNMREQLGGGTGFNRIQTNHDSSTTVFFSCLPYSPYGTVQKKRKRAEEEAAALPTEEASNGIAGAESA